MKPKVVVITGGSNGIGEACAQKFYQNNHKVINLDISNPINDYGLFIKTDLSDKEQIKKVFAEINKLHGDIDILISNAGIHLSANIEDTTEDMYDKVIATNLTSTFFVIQNTIKAMKKKGGRIITIGSDQSLVGKPNSAVYGLTKAAIAQLTKNIALDYSKYGILANCVCPGTIETPLYTQAINDYCLKSGRNVNEVNQEEARLQPVGRIGTSEEVASLIYYLAIEASSFIQGSNIVIDGGYTAK